MKERIYKDIIDIQRDMLRILGEVTTMTESPITLQQSAGDAWVPRCDVFVTDDQFVMRFDLAGVDKKTIRLKSGPEYLRVSGERVFPNDGKNTYYYNLEIDSGAFDRKVYFPDIPIDKDKPEVAYRDGFLEVSFRLCKQEERTIDVVIG